MTPEASIRVQRLVRWVKANKRDLLDAGGGVSPTKLAAATNRRPSYWSDVLRGDESGKSFGDKAAREVEGLLGMPHLHLDGEGWPFDEVSRARFERLTEKQQGRVEQAMIDAITKIEAEQQDRLGGASPDRPHHNPTHQKAA